MTSREWYRPLPPYRNVEWSMRNNTNYMETGVLSALELTSVYSFMPSHLISYRSPCSNKIIVKFCIPERLHCFIATMGESD